MFKKLGRRIRAQVWDYVLAGSAVIIASIGGVLATRIFELTKADNALVIGYASVVIVVFMLISAVIVFWIRPHSLSKWGTGYYVGVLGVRMRDDHGASFKALVEGAGYQDYRAITHKLSEPSSYGFDWVDDINLAYQRMQDSMNEDDVSTGYLIVPNILFPAALAFGSQIYFPNEIELVEMPTFEKEKKDIPANKWPRWLPVDIENYIDSLDDSHAANVNDILASADHKPYIFSSPESSFLSTVERLSGNGVMLVSLTNGREPELGNLFDVGYRFSLKPKDSFNEAKIINDDASKGELHKIYEVSLKNGGAVLYKNIYAKELLFDVLYLISEAMRFRGELDDSDVPIVLCARLPKTISFVLGQAFDLLNPGRQRTSLWENLIILNWEPSRGGPEESWRIARVHPSQLPLEEQYRKLEKYGYVSPPCK